MRHPTFLAAAASMLLIASPVVSAAPHVPASDDVVVERVRPSVGASQGARDARRLRAWQTQVQRQGQIQAQSLPAATAYARTAIEQARREGDPRWLGAAQAALSPWWRQASPPAEARLLRAIIQQSQHAFDAALTDLDALTRDAQAPWAVQAQGRLTRASVHQVQGRWAEAAQDCEALRTSVPIESAACLADLQGLAGDAAGAWSALTRLSMQAGPEHQAWLALMRAELAERMGKAREADALYRQALQSQADVYTLGAYADFLLDHGRAAEVVHWLQPYQQVDGLLLRLALAWRAMGRAYEADAKAAAAALQARFDAAHLRGDRVHLREEARFEWALLGHAQRGHALAVANWAVQKEPADARILMDTARAAGRGDALMALSAWLRSQGLSDVRLAPATAIHLSHAAHERAAS